MKTLKLLFLSSLILISSVLQSYAFGPMAGMLGGTAPFVCGTSTVSVGGLTYGTVVALDTNCWLTKNLGAVQVATSATDTLGYGTLHQWGRPTDGHEIRTSSTTTTNSSTDTPGNALFIIETVDPYDWRVPQNDALWQGLAGTNNPCPALFRLPTETEWNSLRAAENITNVATGFSSSLKLTASGLRRNDNAALESVGVAGYYWTSTTSGTGVIMGGLGGEALDKRADALAVRCVKN
jgi:uncharacterized protein (TIGR02145 family)